MFCQALASRTHTRLPHCRPVCCSSKVVLESTADTPEEILARQERYNKVSDIKITIASAFVGLAF